METSTKKLMIQRKILMFSFPRKSKNTCRFIDTQVKYIFFHELRKLISNGVKSPVVN